MKLQDLKVRVLICTGGAWELVNGVLEYMPFELTRRMLTLPSDLTYSELMNRVAKKLNLNPRSGFQLSCKIPPSSFFHSNNEVIEIGDDEEVSALIDIAIKMPHGMVTLCVVESEGSNEDYSSSGNSGNNQGGNVAPVLETPNINRSGLWDKEETLKNCKEALDKYIMESNRYLERKLQTNLEKRKLQDMISREERKRAHQLERDIDFFKQSHEHLTSDALRAVLCQKEVIRQEYNLD